MMPLISEHPDVPCATVEERRKYSCDQCDFSAFRKSSLEGHKKSKHKGRYLLNKYDLYDLKIVTNYNKTASPLMVDSILTLTINMISMS